MTLTIGSLFSGIGGLELGLERAGLGPILWQCEIDPFCRRVLAKRWPTVTRFDDVTRPRNYPHVDVICGGFPCQDVSSAGARRGIGGQKSSLWWHYADVIRQVRPRFAVVENVASGQKLWLPHVRHQLHMLGYGTRAIALSAADVGAPHIRRRVFVVADSHGVQLRQQQRRSEGRAKTTIASRDGEARRLDGDANREGEPALQLDGQVAGVRGVAADAPAWPLAPELRGVGDGIPNRMDRLRTLGNAVVPQCAEVIGYMIRLSGKKDA